MNSPEKLYRLSEIHSTTHDVSAVQHIPKVVEATWLLGFFPNEIWLKILYQVCHPEDLHNLEESSSFFKELLRTRLLFTEVMKIFITKFPGTSRDIKHVLLKCRNVCRIWENGVNSVLNSFYSNRKLVKNDFVNASESPFVGAGTYFSTTSTVSAFLQHFDQGYATNNRNPFSCRTVYIKLNKTNTRTSFVREFMQVLRIFGHHIWYFTASMIEPESRLPIDLISCFEELRDMLHLMPNLKSLSIDCKSWVANEISSALEQSIQANLFPKLVELQCLRLLNLPAPVSKALLQNHLHVATLEPHNWYTGIESLLYTHQMPNLTQLALNLPDNESLVPLQNTNITWPLTSLSIKIGTINFDWQRLFQILEHRLGETLIELKIKVCDGYLKKSMHALPCLKLPNLKVLLFFSNSFVLMDFILPMSSTLERLLVWYSYRAAEESDFIQNEKVIKLYTFCKNPLESNIWALFPKLKTLEYFDSKVGYHPVLNGRHQNRNKMQ